MTMYYSASFDGGKGGFCDDMLFGPRLMEVPDIAVLNERLIAAQSKDEAEFEAALAAERGEDDPKPLRESYRRRERQVYANPPMKLVDNPDCRLPKDAVEVSPADFEQLMSAQGKGYEIVAAAQGLPVARPREIDADQLLATVRAKRDRELKASDWTQMSDSPLSAAKKKLWADHRAALRDLPRTVEAMLKKAESAAEVDLMAVIPQPPQ